MSGINRRADVGREARLVIERLSKADIIEAYRNLFEQVYPDAGAETEYTNATEIAWAHDLSGRVGNIKLDRKRKEMAARGLETVEDQQRNARLA